VPPQEPPKPFKRSWMRFPIPEKQVLLFLPTAAVLACLVILAALSINRVRTSALEAMDAQGVSSEVSREFLRQTHGFNLAIYAVTALVGVAAILWVWWLSVWIFGPYRRLERDLNEVLYGRMDPNQIRVRKGDALYSLIERVRQALAGRAEPPPK
jgi:hypothetical protein